MMKKGRLDHLPSHLFRCLAYTCLFPRNHVFDKDNLIQLWIAVGFIRDDEETKPLEDIGVDYLDQLQSTNVFQESYLGSSLYVVKGHVYNLLLRLLKCCDEGDDYARLKDDKGTCFSAEVRHLSVLGDRVGQVNFEALSKLSQVQSLLLLQEKRHRQQITCIPCELFLNMTCLRVLDLSYTGIHELPSSVANLEALHYLDLSNTPLERFSVTGLFNLQILKLKDCSKLQGLPKDMKDLINLRHLDLDIFNPKSLPQGMGKLTNLRTLNAFHVSKIPGCCGIAELENLNNLGPSLVIWKLENIVTLQDAKDAKLRNKRYLHQLELYWTMECPKTEKILQALEPPKQLEEFEINNYGGLIWPKWFGDPTFSKLSKILIHNSNSSVLLPPLGRLPCLVSLHIREMHAIRVIDHHFCQGRGTSKGFPKLQKLVFDGMQCLEEWIGLEKDDMPCLRDLSIIDCPKLVKLPNLANLKSLECLEIIICVKLPLLTEKGLPASLQSLHISDCPILAKRCHEEGDDWKMIKGINTIWVNSHKISKNSEAYFIDKTFRGF